MGVTVRGVFLHGKRCLRLIVPEGCDVIHLIQKIRGNITQIIEQMPSNTAWDQVKTSHKTLRTFSEIKDVTEATIQHMTECHAIVSELSLPHKVSLGSYAISLTGNANQFTLSCESQRAEGAKYSFRCVWKVSRFILSCIFSSEILEDGKKVSSSDDVPQNDYPQYIQNLESEILALERIGVLSLLIQSSQHEMTTRDTTLQTLISNQKVQIQQERDRGVASDKSQEPAEEDLLPIDTILDTDSIPHWTIVQKLRFSSLEKLQGQLDRWGIPYSVVSFSRGKRILHNLIQSAEPQPQILILTKKDRMIQEHYIVHRTSDGERFRM